MSRYRALPEYQPWYLASCRWRKISWSARKPAKGHLGDHNSLYHDTTLWYVLGLKYRLYLARNVDRRVPFLTGTGGYRAEISTIRRCSIRDTPSLVPSAVFGRLQPPRPGPSRAGYVTLVLSQLGHQSRCRSVQEAILRLQTGRPRHQVTTWAFRSESTKFLPSHVTTYLGW